MDVSSTLELTDRLPDLHAIALDAVGGEGLTCLEAHGGLAISTAAEPTQREGSHENRAATHTRWFGKSDRVGVRTAEAGHVQG